MENYTTPLQKILLMHEKEINALNKMIIEITEKINNYHPELIDFLNEMPITMPDEKDPCVTIESLKKYYTSLENLIEQFENNHEELSQ